MFKQAHSTNLLIEMVERVDDDKFLDRKLEQECDSLNEKIDTRSLILKAIDIFGKQKVSQDARIIEITGEKQPQSIPNIVKNQKYSIITFIPIVLFDQFRYFFNLFFLLITLSQFIEPLKVGFLFSYVAPLVFVLTLTLIKEAYDDFKRFLRDREANSQLYSKILQNDVVSIKSSQLRVGDVIEVHANQRVPADCVLLRTSEKTGTVFIRTDQLDGETDWKLRSALKLTQLGQFFGSTLIVEAPKLDIYDFKGRIKIEEDKESVSIDNTLWANTYVAAGKVTCVVIYTGRECRSSMNQRKSRFKMGRLDKELNFLSKVLFGFMCILAGGILILTPDNDVFINLLQFFRYVLLLSSIIPISLRVNLDFSKLVFSMKINSDKDIAGAMARNSQIPEELGRVHYILSDKTGTLTQNCMTFKKLALESNTYTTKDLNVVNKILKRQFSANPVPLHDIITGKTKRNSRRNKDVVLRDLIQCLSLCHNVTPIIEDGIRSFQASSPDEIALVQISEQMGIQLISRNAEQMVIQTPNKVENFKIVYEFPFSSERKRMGIIVQSDSIDGYFFYLKGADQIIKNKVPEVQRGFLMDEAEMLSREGLRTLVMTQKYITSEEFKKWQVEYEEAKSSMDDREIKVNHALEQLEQGMEFLGISGVEDLLQEDINHCIDQLRNAGIKIWMLTGDKVETAQCIAISAGLKTPQQEMFTIKEADSLNLQNLLNQFSAKHNSILVIDGVSLSLAFNDHFDQFMYVTSRAPCVICCRCSPTQKAQVVEAIKKNTNQVTLAIGDGGNDVSMIQAADVGIGIVGKEGKQAALASDFSIMKFKDLSTLLLWHGRLAYKRSSVMAQFVMHRGLVISVIQAIFSFLFYGIAIPIYNGYLMLGYATVFTVLPVFSLIFDEDITKNKALEFAELYKSLQKGREVTTKTFLIWLWKSIYQGTVIMALSFLCFQNTFLQLVTVTFTALIVIELLNVITELKTFKFITLVSQFISISLYLCCIYFMRDVINLSEITVNFVMNVGLLVLASWLPLHLVEKAIHKYYPSEADKIMEKINH
ncbi:unnamed protein product (macronuclear) [Paramecium tetraurelia]|uniref:Phospholipid-transporting ATPase n=1 Tax=Paramecium tetraurelia TaxID=5888 RepID=A0CYH1_PARTE|nr:uncharacterized protein GSPATT00011438001 [Paramecium tetraurelia]CAK75838.1 unnamed protein product [Paramecium tetraurelia]|eukprot:XP_001443235.1 hypothetical protein (macronuclear) [Paramecium tetraurelia strain d4-2]